MEFNLQDMEKIKKYYEEQYRKSYKNLLDTIESVQFFLEEDGVVETEDTRQLREKNKNDTIEAFEFFDPSDDYETAEKIAKLITQATSNPSSGEIYKKASDAYNNIMFHEKWENQINFGQVLATEQYNRNKFNEIVQQLADMLDDFNPAEYYMCEVFDGAAQIIDSNAIEIKRDADGDCDGQLVSA